MRFFKSNIFKSPVRIGLAMSLVASVVVGTPAQAFDAGKTFQETDEPRTILRYGFQALKKGNMEQGF